MSSGDENYSDYYSEESSNTQVEATAEQPVNYVPVEKYQELEGRFNQTSQVIDNLRNVFNPQQAQPQIDPSVQEALSTLRQHGITTQDEVRQMISQELQMSQANQYATQAGYNGGVQELIAEYNLARVRASNNPQAQAMLNQIESAWSAGNIKSAVDNFRNFMQGNNSQIPSQPQMIGHQIGNMPNFNKQQLPYSSESEYMQKLMSGDPEANRYNLMQMAGKINKLYPS